jgi:hypothetical protein
MLSVVETFIATETRMYLHANARLTPAARLLLVRRGRIKACRRPLGPVAHRHSMAVLAAD